MKKNAFFFFLGLFVIGAVAPGQTEPSSQPTGPLILSLEDCIRIGLQNNPQIKIAEAKLESAKGKMISTRSYLIPKVTASGVITRTNMLPTFETGDLYLIPTTFPMANSTTPLPPDHMHFIPFSGFSMSNTREGDVYSTKVEVTYPLYTGGRTTSGYKAAKLEVDAAEIELKQKKQELVFQIKQSYYQLLLAKEMVVVIDRAYATMEGHYKQVQDLYKNGFVSNLDLLQVEAKLSSIRPQQIQVHSGLNLATLVLKNILNLDPKQEIEVTGLLEYGPEELAPLEELVNQALSNRPELKTLAVRKQQGEELVKMSYAGYLPTVALFANYQWNRGTEMPPNDTIWREGWQAGVSASITLFDGFQSYGETMAAKGQLEQINLGEQALRSGIETEVTAAYLKLVSAKESVDAEKKNVEASTKNSEAANRRYREGMVNHLDVLDAEMSLTQAQAGYLRAVSDYLIAKAGLEKAIGKGEVE